MSHESHHESTEFQPSEHKVAVTTWQPAGRGSDNFSWPGPTQGKPAATEQQHAVRDTVAAAARDWFGGAWRSDQAAKSSAPRTASTPSAVAVVEGKRRGRSPTVRLTRNSDWEVVRAAARTYRQMKAACVFVRKKKREDVPWPGSQDLRWMDRCGSSM